MSKDHYLQSVVNRTHFDWTRGVSLLVRVYNVIVESIRLAHLLGDEVLGCPFSVSSRVNLCQFVRRFAVSDPVGEIFSNTAAHKVRPWDFVSIKAYPACAIP